MVAGALGEQQQAEYEEVGYVRLPGFGDDVTGKAMLDRVVEIAHQHAAGDRSTGWVLPEANLAGPEGRPEALDGHLMHRSTDNESDGIRAAMVFRSAATGTVDLAEHPINDFLTVRG